MAECGGKSQTRIPSAFFSASRKGNINFKICANCGANQVERGRGGRVSSQSESSEKANKEEEIRVCVSKACSKTGSPQTLQLLTGLAPPHVKVKSCNCLGRCGSGPNLVVLPAEIFVSHCTTAAHAAHLLAAQCGASDPANNLIALSLKEQGNKEFECRNAFRAEQLYSQAIELKPSGGQHFLYANRSAVRLAIGDNAGSLSDAKEASRITSNWHVPYTRQGDAYFALGEYAAAELAFSRALAIEPSLRRSKAFK
ncbi:hypothetical protein KI387_018316, partial [Taxus chinensis]